MPANHCMPHTEEAKAKMRASHAGKPRPWKHRPTREIDGVVHFRCGKCHGFFPRNLFHPQKRTLLGIKTDCKKCHNACSVATRDVQKKRKLAVQYEAQRRARKVGSQGKVSPSDWNKLISILGSRCLCCGADDAPTQDHIIPLSKGGVHDPSNLQPLCRPCNERKQASAIDYRTTEQRLAVREAWVVEFKKA